jgi:sugar phosphate isomerase/epimerase
MDIGISTACFFSKASTEDSLSIIKQLGFNVCEIFLTTFSEYIPEFAVLLKSRLNGLKVYSVHSLNQHFEPELFNIMERTRKDSEFFFRQIGYTANLLGANYYTFHGPARLKRLPYNLNYNWIAERLAYLDNILVDLTGGICKIAYENVHWTYFNSPDFYLNLKPLYATNTCLDIKQAMQSNIDVYKYIEAMGNKLANVHLCDYNLDGSLALPGKGIFDFINFFSVLLQEGYSGPLIIEVYPKDYQSFDELTQSKLYLEECLDKAKCKINNI